MTKKKGLSKKRKVSNNVAEREASEIGREEVRNRCRRTGREGQHVGGGGERVREV